METKREVEREVKREASLSSDRSTTVQSKESSIDQPLHDEADKRSMRPHIPLKGGIFWSVADIIYGASIAGIALYFIPIKTSKLPAVPYTLITFGALTALLGALTLWSARHLGGHRGARRMMWRVNLTLTTLIASSGLLLTALCLMSGLYWLGVFGVLGWGVFISSLLLLSGVIQLLVLYPLLKLRRILSAPYREHFRGGQVAVRSIQALMICIMSAGCVGAYAGSLSELESLSDSQRDAVTGYLRATLEGSPITPAGEALSREGVLNKTISAAPRKKKEQRERRLTKRLKIRVKSPLTL